MMYFPDEYDLNVKNVDRVEPTAARDHPEEKDREKKKKKPAPDEASEHFQELAKAAEFAHEKLIRNGSPYRFCVYREAGEVYIDLVLLDRHGKIREIKRKNITHLEFRQWLAHIENGEGLFFDSEI